MLPGLAVAVSLLAVPLVLASGNRPRLRESWTLAAAVAKLGIVATMLPGVLDGRYPETSLGEIVPGVEIALRVDPLGLIFALVASSLWIATSVYSIGYVAAAQERNLTRYYAAFATCLAATIGVAFAANLVTFILFYEVLTIATYPLVVHKGTPEAIRAGRKYLAYTLTAGVALLAGAIWTQSIAGSLDFVAGGLLDGVAGSDATFRVLFALFVGGLGVKAAIMPLHAWLPAAMVAPTPVSALLHAVAVVKSGVFGMIRVVAFVFGPGLMADAGLATPLLVAAGATVVIASLIALGQDNLKRRLAYSTVGHLSYIVLGAALLHPTALAGGILHITTHATMKITMFFVAGAIYAKTRRQSISQLDGIGRMMPWTMGAFTVAAIGLTGLPPINGFVSKWFIGAGAVEAGNEVVLVVLLVSGLLNAAYFFPIIHRAFFRPPAVEEHRDEAPPSILIPLLVTAALSILFGVWPDALVHFYDLAEAVADSVFGVSS
jgi:multicomponent Na+:H+ antiporter subunit D